MVIQNFAKAGYPFEYIFFFFTCSEAATEVFYKKSVLKNFAVFTGKQRWDFKIDKFL